MAIELLTGQQVVVMLSGGRDSVCLLDLAVARGCAVTALHVNYGLRPDAPDDEAFCRELCAALGVPLVVSLADAPAGNVQAWAREVRYRAALALEGDIAVGHTATDQVETVLYRLAASPGRRALLGMRARDGRIIRPLLDMTREQTAAHCRARGLAWRDDPTNDDPVYARNRVRAGLVPLLRELHPAAEANVLRTLEVLRDEAELLDAFIADAGPFAELGPAMQRLTLQKLADEAWAAAGRGAEAAGRGAEAADDTPAAGRGAEAAPAAGRGPGPSVASRAEEVADLARRGGSHRLDLGGGLRAVVEYGAVRVESAADEAAPDPVLLTVPGAVAWGEHELRAERGEFDIADGVLAGVPDRVEVRAWRHGDRMRPLGLDGSRSLQDLFTDRKVPRARRRALPIVIAGGEIAWIPGVATAERFRVTGTSDDRVRFSWS